MERRIQTFLPQTSGMSENNSLSLSSDVNELDALLNDFEMNPVEEITAHLFDDIDGRLLKQNHSNIESITETINYQASTSDTPKPNAFDKIESETVIYISSDDEIDVDDPKEVENPSYDTLNSSAATKTSSKPEQPSKSTPGIHMMQSETVISLISDDEFEVDDPEEVKNLSNNILNSSAAAKNSSKPGQPSKSTPGRHMMESETVISLISDDEYEVDDPEEVGDPTNVILYSSAAAKTTSKRRLPSKSNPGREKNAKVVDDDDVEEVLPKKGRVVFAKPATLSSKMCERVENIPIAIATTSAMRVCSPKSTPVKKKNVQLVYYGEEEEEKDNHNMDAEDEEFVEEEYGDYDIEEYEEIDDEEEDSDQEEELNQRPGDKPAIKFTLGAFVVLKTDMISEEDPPVWKIDGDLVLRKYIPFNLGGKVLYKSTKVYDNWHPFMKWKYYDAPISFVQQTQNSHIIEFFKNKVKKN